MADMTITQREESMNSLIKDYIDSITSLVDFLKVFESALEIRKDDAEFIKFCEENKNTLLLIISPYKS